MGSTCVPRTSSCQMKIYTVPLPIMPLEKGIFEFEFASKMALRASIIDSRPIKDRTFSIEPQLERCLKTRPHNDSSKLRTRA